MKTISLLLSLLLIALALKPFPVAAEAAPDPERRWWPHPGQHWNETCPLDVVQEQHEVSNGLPLMFIPVNPKKGVIRVSTDHNIEFSAATICVQSTVWKLEYDESSGQQFVTTGGVEGNPGRGTLSNWFKIEKYEDDNNLVFCPTVV
ncbi:Miraculin [Vitis vinifera]|uniref:Miraculin n=1 Tax=Vitis vinifera TaxID=29760 RepID=A0A438FHC8_VITVI|nr:Miraculin [Vitis vinifera]